MTTRYWLTLSVIFFFLEIVPPSTHFFLLCLSFGALGGAIASVYAPAFWVPWAVGAVTSIALIPLLVPLAKFLFAPERRSSNKSHASHVQK